MSGLEATLPGGRVVFSQRRDGNMSSVGGAQSARGTLNRELLRERLRLRSLARCYQVHGTELRHVLDAAEDPDGNEGLQHADGLLTREHGIGLGVLSADCLPVALGCEGAVAALHAGWRGLAAGMLERGVAAMRELAGESARLSAVVGPAAGVCCYEVGPEVHAALGLPALRGPVDLRAVAHARLLAAGVQEVGDAGGCTICDERCFSHRREGESAGRMIAVAWLD